MLSDATGQKTKSTMEGVIKQIEGEKEKERRERLSKYAPVVPGVLAGIVTPEDEKRAADRRAAEEAEMKKQTMSVGERLTAKNRIRFGALKHPYRAGGRRKTLRTKFNHCVKSVRKTVKARKGSNKESAAIAICTKTVLHPRGRTLKRYRKGRLLTQKKLRSRRSTMMGGNDNLISDLDAMIKEIKEITDEKTKENNDKYVELKKTFLGKLYELKTAAPDADDNAKEIAAQAWFAWRDFENNEGREQYSSVNRDDMVDAIESLKRIKNPQR